MWIVNAMTLIGKPDESSAVGTEIQLSRVLKLNTPACIKMSAGSKAVESSEGFHYIHGKSIAKDVLLERGFCARVNIFLVKKKRAKGRDFHSARSWSLDRIGVQIPI